MYKVYFKQAIELLRQNKFISIISIVGTALAIMMVMVIVVVDQVKNADVSPESNRSQLYQIDYQKASYAERNINNSGLLSSQTINILKEEIKSASKISANDGLIMDYNSKTSKVVGSKTRIPLDIRGVDAVYWELFSFDFIAGKPFTEADFEAQIKKIVLSESLALQFFGKSSAIGQKILIDINEYTVVGVVRDVSKVFKNAYAQAWIPHSKKQEDAFQLLLLLDPSRIEQVNNEVRRAEELYALTNEGWKLTLFGPFSHRDAQLNIWNFEKDKKVATKRMIAIFAILMLIPAINLSSLSLSRVKRRIEEIGIRKSFGAQRRTILMQVLYENFITSLLGGIIGLVLSVIIVSLMKGWLLGATDASSIPLNALLSLPILLTVVVVSFVLNLLSSGIPAWRAANMNIVDSINQKNN